MRKLFLLFVALLATTALWAHDFVVAGIYYNYLDDNNVAVTYKGSSDYHLAYYGEVIIPETVTYKGTTYSVASIGEYAFRNCRSLTSITIGNSVTSIGERSFSNCSSLSSITIPNSVTSIGSTAFGGCSSLTSITIPNSVTSIGGCAFQYCSSLTSITIPESVTSIGGGAFDGTSIYNNESNWVNEVLYIDNCLIEAKTSISGIYAINDNTQVIAERAFSLCSSLTSITIPNSVTGIGTLAFESCSSLTSIIIPNSVTNIGKYPLWGCSSLTSIVVENGNTTYDSRENCNAIIETATNALINGCRNTFIPNSVTSIGDNAFCQCTALTSITIPEGVTSIGYGAFSSCRSLTSVTIPNSVTSIGGYAFGNCSSLTSITIGNSVTSIGNHAFYGCSSLTSVTIPESVTSIGDYAFSGCSKLTSVTIPNSVTSIGDYAFSGCSSLTSVTIPNSVTSIGSSAFYGCIFAKENFVNHSVLDAEENDYWGARIVDTEIDGLLIRNDTVIDCRPNVTSVIIPNSVTSIGSSAFSSCSKLTSVTIPNSVTSIGSSAFSSCSKLTSVTIPNSVTSIGDEAFRDCSSLTSVTIPNSVTSIREYAFSSCSSLTSITIPNSVTSIGYAAFYICSSLTSVTIPNSVKSIGDYAFGRCSSLTSMIVENGNTIYDSRENCNAIIETATNTLIAGCQNTIIPNSVKSIGDYAFGRCSFLTSITIPNNVTSIGEEAFYYCSSLTHITIGNSITSINSDAFKGCSSLTSIVWNVKQWTNPNNYSPFSDIKTNITSFTFGNDVEQIPAYICFGMEKLNAVNIPNATTSIGENAFAGCTKLYDIYCYAMEPPTAYESSFANYNAFLHVPCDNQRVYLLDVLFGNFKYVECIEAETTPTDTVVVTPSFNDAEFIWPSNSSADSYTLAISKDGEVFCTLTFNANGQLTGIAFAPSRNGQHHTPAAAQLANGFAFTVTGLDEGANYTYDLLIQDRSGNTLQSYSGEFRTQSTNDRTVTVEYDAAQGQVTGAGTYLVGDTVTLTAIPNDGYRFVRWSNEVEDNPYTFVISDNVTLSAEFEAVIPSSPENTNSQSPMSNYQKIIRDGQLLILRDGKTYNVMGAEIQ